MSPGKLHLYFAILPTRFKNAHDSKKLRDVTVTKVTGPADAAFPFLAFAYRCHLRMLNQAF